MALSRLEFNEPILAKIYSHLSYRDLISLSRSSRIDRRLIGGDPAARASFEDKIAFVMHAEGTFPQHFPRTTGQESPGNFACFWCFRVRGPEHFDNWQDNVFWNVAEQRVERVGEDPGHVHSYSHGHRHSRSRGQACPPEFGQQILPPPSPSPSPKMVQQAPRLPHQDPRVMDGQLAGLRRFCIDCGLKHSLYQPGDTIQTKARDSREMWVCRCPKRTNGKTVTKCETCGDIAPMRPRKRWY